MNQKFAENDDAARWILHRFDDVHVSVCIFRRSQFVALVDENVVLLEAHSVSNQPDVPDLPTSCLKMQELIARGEFSAALEELKKGGQYVIQFDRRRRDMTPFPAEWVCEFQVFAADRGCEGPPMFMADSLALRDMREACNTAAEKILRSLVPERFRIDAARDE